MQTLRGKIIFFGLFISLFTGLVMSFYALKKNKEYFEDIYTKDAEFKLSSIIQTIKSNSDKIKTDALFLASTPPIQGILRAKNNNGIDPKDNSSIELWKSRLQKIFEEMLYVNSDYTQIRYIGVDNKGLEIVRSERFGNKVKSIKEKDLQKKGERPYFTETIKNYPNTVYFSRITANKEFGKVIYPIQLVIRAGVPIYDGTKKAFGGLFINANYTSLLKGLDYFNGTEHILLIKDENSRPLLSFSNGFKFYNDESEEQINHKDLFENIKDGDYPPILEKKIYYNDLDPSQYLVISFSLSSNKVIDELNQSYIDEGMVLFFLLLITGFISYLAARKFVKPITSLQNLTKKLGEDEYSESDLIYSNDKGEIGMLTNTLIDMTKNVRKSRKQADNQKEALDSSAIVAETDLEGNITYINDKFVKASGYEKGEVIGQSHYLLSSGHHSEEFFVQMKETIESGLIWRGEVKNKRKDGSFYWVDTTIYPVRNEEQEIVKYIAINLDITEQKRVQEEFKKALETKSSFLANMSHEIRTPLNGIIGFADILSDKDLDKESAQEILQIKNCGEGLLQIINDILDITKMESGKLQFTNDRFSLSKCLKNSVDVLSTDIKNKQIKFNYIIDPLVEDALVGDELRIRQVLLNILGNAVKFTPEKGSVDLEISLEKEDQLFQTLKFIVEDTGIGIKKEMQDELFTSFTQADNSISKEYGGTGLGLAISKQILEKLNGNIWIESEEGKGAKVFFTMVVAKDHSSEPKEVPKIESVKLNSESSMKILIVEDSKINQMLVEKLISKIGRFDITFAENGEEAIECLKVNDFPIVLMDIQMPVLDGLSATKRIRKELKYKGLIIGLSANAFQEDYDKAFAAGMDYYLAKPINSQKIQDFFKRLKEEKGLDYFV